MIPQTLREVAYQQAETRPSQPLVCAPDPELGRNQSRSYEALLVEAQGLAAVFAARGLRVGDKVALFLPNGARTAATFLAILVSGCVATPINLLLSPARLAAVLSHCDCKIILTTPDLDARLRAALVGLARPVDILHIDQIQNAGLSRKPEVLERLGPLRRDDPALLMYTSGTTGEPKGVVLSHANLLAAARSVIAWHDLIPDDRVYSALPLYHINGQVIATIAPFVSGGSLVAPRSFSVKNFWSDVERLACTWINVVPTMIAYLLNAPAPAQPQQGRIRFARSASAPLPPEHHKAFEARFAIPVIEAMGMTESASVVFCNPHDRPRKYGSVGLACGVEARIVNSTGQPLPDMALGQILFRGANVMQGYYKAPLANAEAFDPDGFLRSGDLGYRDKEGFVFVTGRIKELIIKGGENISPREIDQALLAHPAILEAAAVGIPDANYGQDILAAVVLKPGATCRESEIRAHCLRLLGRFLTPREFRFVAELPKGPSGKIQRLALALADLSPAGPSTPVVSEPAR